MSKAANRKDQKYHRSLFLFPFLSRFAAHHSPLVRSRDVRSIALKTLGKERDCSQSRNKPLGIFLDKDSEYLSFPSIFCGKRRSDNNERKVPVSYSTIAQWELRSQDRRAAMSVPNIFYKLKKLQIKQIQDSACISLRKCKTKREMFHCWRLEI